MDIRKRLNPKKIFVILYGVAFFGYVLYGLQPAEAVDAYETDAVLEIPSIGLISDVTSLERTDDGLMTPESIVGSYKENSHKTLLIGHSTGVFRDLDAVKIGDVINYDGVDYNVLKLVYAAKEAIDMEELIAPAEKDTLVIMTCAGELLGNGDATHRLIIFASV